MEGTHIRFARDLADRLGVTEEAAYYSGAAYPDSRYVTRIARSETHGDHCPQDPFAAGLSDFEKGWATHLYYDRHSTMLRKPFLDALPREMMSDEWAVHTAMKMIEDIKTCEVLGADLAITQRLICVERPSDEDAEIMDRYYRNIGAAYQQAPTVDLYASTLFLWGVPEENVRRMKEVGLIFLEDPRLVAAIEGVYGQVIAGL